MALQPTYDNAEAIPEGLRDHYAERDGSWHLELSGDPAGYAKESRLIQFRESNMNLTKERDQLKAREAELAKQIRDLQAGGGKSQDKGNQGKPDALADLQREVAELRAERKAEREAVAAERAEHALRTQLADAMGGHFLDGAARLAFLDATAQGFRLVDGKVIRLNEAGNPVYNDETQQPETLVDFVKRFRTDHAYMLKPSSGAHSNTNGTGSGTTPPGSYPKKRTEFTDQQTIAFIREHGREEYMKLPA